MGTPQNYTSDTEFRIVSIANQWSNREKFPFSREAGKPCGRDALAGRARCFSPGTEQNRKSNMDSLHCKRQGRPANVRRVFVGISLGLLAGRHSTRFEAY
jgi:hypothetical protein